RGEFPPPRAINRAIPAALEAICRRAIALRPEDRYASAKALAEDVERWLAAEPVAAYREPWADRARRWVGRHRTLVTGGRGGGVGAVAAGAGLTAILWVQARANRSLKASNDRLEDAIGRESLANVQLRAAVGREQSARRQAQARFALALEAVRRYYTGA